MKYAPHSKAWYERLSEIQTGYWYPWNSQLPAYNGEQMFLDLVHSAIDPHHTVLDVGCGHGALALQLAAHCQRIEGYDRVATYIEIARKTQEQQGIANAHFVCHDSSADANNGAPHIPYDEDTFDLIISRRGPLNFLDDVRRVAKNRTQIIQLNPVHPPFPEWAHLLPADLEIPGSSEDDFLMRNAVFQRLADAQLSCDAFWCIDVPEYFSSTENLYTYLTWNYLNEPAYSYQELEPVLSKIFAQYAIDGNVAIRQRRFLWTSIVYK